MGFRTSVIALCAVLAPCAALAQDAPIAERERRVAAAQAAQQRGALMMAIDQAAWHATDRFVESAGAGGAASLPQLYPGISGYVVVPSQTTGQFDALFVAERPGGPVAVARYRVSMSEVLSGGPLERGQEQPLTALEARMFAARKAVLAAAAQQRLALCSQSAPNTLVLPPDANGTIVAYVMTSITDGGHYPIGGHFRAEIAPDGTVGSFSPSMNTCIDARWDSTIPNLERALFAVNHLLTDHPTEFHVFASYHMPLGLGVITKGVVWPISRGRVGDPFAVPANAGTGAAPAN